MAQIQRFKQSRFGHEVFGIYLPSDLRGSGDTAMDSISAGIFRTIHRIIRRFDKPLQVEVVPVLG